MQVEERLVHRNSRPPLGMISGEASAQGARLRHQSLFSLAAVALSAADGCSEGRGRLSYARLEWTRTLVVSSNGQGLPMYCTQCGTLNGNREAGCSSCGHALHPQAVAVPPAMPVPQAMPPAAPAIGDDPAMRMLLPVGRSGWAIAAGYLGLISVLGLPGPIALVVSIVAIVDLRRPGKKRGWGRAIFGLIMGLLGTAGLVVYLLETQNF